MRRWLWGLAYLCGAVGLIALLGVMWSGAAYPSPLFRIGVPVGLAALFLCMALLGMAYLWDICAALRKKQWVVAVGLVAALLVVGVLALL